MDFLEKNIKDVLHQARSFLLPDGGDLSFERFENGIVFVKLHGACQRCPISDLHLKISVEEFVKERIPEVHEVKAI